MDMVSAVMYEGRRETVNRARDLKESVAMHREIYRLIRAGKADEARAAMSEHLALAQQAFDSEEGSGKSPTEVARVKTNATNGKRPAKSKRPRGKA